jgi:hypothetical protein
MAMRSSATLGSSSTNGRYPPKPALLTNTEIRSWLATRASIVASAAVGEVHRDDLALSSRFALQPCGQLLKPLAPAGNQDQIMPPTSQLPGILGSDT